MNIVLTGASSGIGLECAKVLKKDFNDAKFALVGRNTSAIDNLILSEKLDGSKSYNYDLKDSLNITSLVDDILKNFGNVDSLVYCAGISINERLRKIKPTLAQEMMAINYLSFLELVRLLSAKKDKKQAFKVVVISSISAVGSFPFTSIYASSKAAIEASVKALAPELADLNTTINCVRPAVVDTPMIADIKEAQGEDFDLYVRNTLRQYTGVINPTTIANSVSFLLSEKSQGISGDVITVSSAFAM